MVSGGLECRACFRGDPDNDDDNGDSNNITSLSILLLPLPVLPWLVRRVDMGDMLYVYKDMISFLRFVFLFLWCAQCGYGSIAFYS